jgi:DNA-binding NarL/FixJ family response regulator
VLIPPGQRITTLLVAEDELTLLGLRLLLRSVDAVGEVLEASGRQDAVRLAARGRPGLVVADLTGVKSPAASALIDDLALLRLDAPLLVYTDDPSGVLERCAEIRMLCTCLSRGRDSASQLCHAIESVLPASCRGPHRESNVLPGMPESDGIASLTAREREVLSRVAAGEPSRRIAQALRISLRTVESHRSRVCAKLGVRTVAGLTKLAVNAGLTPLNEMPLHRGP